MRKPGKGGPATSRFKVQDLRSSETSPKKWSSQSQTRKTKPSDGDFVAATRGLDADAFFGASPVVASALDLRSGATPAETQTLPQEENHSRARSYS